MALEIKIDVECLSCGAELEIEYSQGTCHVKPCQSCLDELELAYEQRLQDSYDEGYEDGCKYTEENSP